MFLLFLIRVADYMYPPVWKKSVHSAHCACLLRCLSMCVCASFPFDFEGRIWDWDVEFDCITF